MDSDTAEIFQEYPLKMKEETTIKLDIKCKPVSQDKFCVEKEEQLIALVSKTPFLFNKDFKLYKDRDLKDQAWAEIGNKLGVDGQAARKKWGYLRDQFVRHLRWELVFGRRVHPRHRTFPYFDQMNFLMAIYKPKDTGCKLPWDKTCQSFEQVYVPGNLKTNIELTRTDTSAEEMEFLNAPATESSIEQYPAAEDVDENFLESEVRKNPSSKSDDSITHFMRSVENYLRVADFTAVEMLALQSGILDLIRECLEKRKVS